MQKIIFYLSLLLIGPITLISDGAILKDLSLRSETLAPAFVNVQNPECSSILFLVHLCSYEYDLDGVTQEQDYNLIAFGAPQQVQLLRSFESGRMTSTTGQEYIWNRIFTLVIAMLISGFTALTMVAAFLSMGKDEEPSFAASRPNVSTNSAPQSAHVPRNTQPNFGRRTSFGTKSSR